MASTKFARFDPGPILEEFSGNENDEMELDQPNRILRIAVDFGTTFSSVAYALTPETAYLMRLNDIACVARYPGDNPIPMVTQQWEPRQDVPTELLYIGSNNKSRSLRKSTKRVQDEIRSDPESSNETDDSAISIENFNNEVRSTDLVEPAQSEKQGQSDTILWGFEVHEQLATKNDFKNEDKHITKAKLTLDNPRHDEHEIQIVVSSTRKKLQKLQKQKLIRSESDAITHYLEKLLIHVKRELEQAGRWDAATNVEFVLCVPAIWPSKACRIMQKSMAIAVKSSGLSVVRDDEIANLFIVSEPEAAATCIMAEQENGLIAGETIVIIDAGGGTVDAITYRIDNTNPLRMSAEVIPPKTSSCGAGYINERYKKFLLEKLEGETYLEKNGKTIQSIIAREVLRFENTAKRIWNPYDPSRNIQPIYIDDLRASLTDSKIRQNQLRIFNKDAEKIFRFSLKGTADVLEDQLDMAKAKGCSVQKVLLTGGFGQSPFLQSYLRRFLNKQANFNLDGQIIELLVPRAASTAVARGAVLRASDKKLGPTRISSCSYGFLRSEPWQEEACAAHRGAKRTLDPIDGEVYVLDTIDWLFQQGEELYVGKHRSIIARHTFALSQQKFICKEFLYVSDDFKESHYWRGHAMNKGAEIAGSIVVDMTFLKEHSLITPKSVSEHSAFHRKNKKVWVVEFELVMIVNGRNLVCEARWPVDESEEDGPSVQQQVVNRSQVCIAATFKPGTA